MRLLLILLSVFLLIFCTKEAENKKAISYKKTIVSSDAYDFLEKEKGIIWNHTTPKNSVSDSLFLSFRGAITEKEYTTILSRMITHNKLVKFRDLERKNKSLSFNEFSFEEDDILYKVISNRDEDYFVLESVFDNNALKMIGLNLELRSDKVDYKAYYNRYIDIFQKKYNIPDLKLAQNHKYGTERKAMWIAKNRVIALSENIGYPKKELPNDKGILRFSITFSDLKLEKKLIEDLKKEDEEWKNKRKMDSLILESKNKKLSEEI